jgi:hypothetical protein
MPDYNGLGTYPNTETVSAAMLEAGATQDATSKNTDARRMTSGQSISDSLNNTPLGTLPRSSLNPLQLGPVGAPWKEHPDYRNPTTDPKVGVQTEGKRNPLGVNGPLPVFSQPGVAAPPPPVAGQLSTMSYGSIGTSKRTNADGSVVST